MTEYCVVTDATDPYLCTCGQSRSAPLCDGFHQRLSGGQSPMALSSHLLLTELLKKLLMSSSYFAVREEIEEGVIRLVPSRGAVIYMRGRNGEIHGQLRRDVLASRPLRLAIGSGSIAGYVALTQKEVMIGNLADVKALREIHPGLRHDERLSGFPAQSTLAVPICHGRVLVGVIQLFSDTRNAYDRPALEITKTLADFLGQKFRHELNGTNAPFEQLVLSGKITAARLAEAEVRAEREGRSVALVLMRDANLSQWEIGRSLERYYQVPFMAFNPDWQPPGALLKGISRVWLRKNRVVPVAGDHQEAVILTDDPADIERLRDIERFIPARSYVFRVGIAEEIDRFFEESSTAVVSLSRGGGLASLRQEMEREIPPMTQPLAPETELADKDSLVIRIVNEVILHAIVNRVSDIHVVPSRPPQPGKVRLRVDGVCRDVMSIPGELMKPVLARIKILAQMDITGLRLPQDGKMFIKSGHQVRELRAAVLPTIHGETAVLRLLSVPGDFTLEKMGFHPRNLERFQRILHQPHGLVLVVGPTGSGKTTTLHAAIKVLNTPDRVIWTAEDPVEISQDGLNQVQINTGAGFTFARALRAFLRADPDVIMIGEMRDLETSTIAVEAALTGHLVFSTLHTNSALETISRLLGLGLSPVDFSESLLGIVAQRMARVLCTGCRVAAPLAPKEAVFLARHGDPPDAELVPLMQAAAAGTLFRAQGCDQCHGTGYRGRIAIHEVLENLPIMRRGILRGAEIDDLRKEARANGMFDMMRDGLIKVGQGQTDLAELMRLLST